MDGLAESTVTPSKHPGPAHGRRERSHDDPHLQPRAGSGRSDV